MRALTAHVENGRIVTDEPLDLPEGTRVQVVPVESDRDGFTAEERAELEQALDDGRADFERGEHEDARAFAARLLEKP